MREVARLNPDLQGVLDVKDYNERQSGQRTLDDDRLAALIEVVSRHRLGLRNTEPDILGRAYEYLLRKFAEGQGQSAGEFYTPKEVGWLHGRAASTPGRTTHRLRPGLRLRRAAHQGAPRYSSSSTPTSARRRPNSTARNSTPSPTPWRR